LSDGDEIVGAYADDDLIKLMHRLRLLEQLIADLNDADQYRRAASVRGHRNRLRDRVAEALSA
jgi:hypothetical protein